MSPQATYLGDAVYALWDGFSITLRLNDHRNAQGEIVLEPETLANLERMLSAIKEGLSTP